MSKKRKKLAKDNGVDDELRHSFFFVPAKHESGRVFVQWDEPDSNPPTFNLNYIDDSIATADCNHRVVAYHVGHDHGYGFRHRHYFSGTKELDASHDWNKCTTLFFDDVSAEVMKSGRVPSTLLDASTLYTYMTTP